MRHKTQRENSTVTKTWSLASESVPVGKEISREPVLDSLRKKSREAVVLLAEDSAGHSAWVLGMCGQQPEGSIGDKPPGTGIPKRHQAKKKKKIKIQG